MIRRYCLAVVGGLLMAALLSAIVRVAPWTLSFVDRSDSYAAGIVIHKLVGVIGVLILTALVGFMALGERMGIIKPPKSDAISLFDNGPVPATTTAEVEQRPDDSSSRPLQRGILGAASAPVGSLKGSTGTRS